MTILSYLLALLLGARGAPFLRFFAPQNRANGRVQVLRRTFWRQRQFTVQEESPQMGMAGIAEPMSRSWKGVKLRIAGRFGVDP
jgi:hypothetical protein